MSEFEHTEPNFIEYGFGHLNHTQPKTLVTNPNSISPLVSRRKLSKHNTFNSDIGFDNGEKTVNYEFELTEYQKEINNKLMSVLNQIDKFQDASEYSKCIKQLEQFLEKEEESSSEDLCTVLELKRDDNESTLLHKFAATSPEILRLFLNSGADPNLQDKSGNTPLHIAAENNNSVSVEMLFCLDSEEKTNLRKKADPNIKNEYKRIPLHTAIPCNNYNITKLFLDADSDINAVDKNGYTPLYLAIDSNFVENVELLVENGAIISTTHDELRKPLLHYAIMSNSDIIPEIFLTKQKESAVKEIINSTDKLGRSALHCAALLGSANIVHLLIHGKHKVDDGKPYFKNTANVYAKDKKNNNVLHFASYNSYRFIRRHDSPRDSTPTELDLNDDTYSITQTIIDYVKQDWRVHIKDFINEKNENGNTALMFAAESRNEETVEIFLEGGADPSKKNNFGFTAFHYAVKEPKILELLFKYGKNNPARIVDYHGNNLLHHAIKFGCSEETIDLLVKAGINIDAKNKNGVAPIHIAAKYGNINMINCLIRNGADINLKCKSFKKDDIGDIGKEYDVESIDNSDILVRKENTSKSIFINVRDGNLDPSCVINIQDNTQYSVATPLHIADNPDAVHEFLLNGANPNIKDSSKLLSRGLTAIEIAVKRAVSKENLNSDNLEVIKELAQISKMNSIKRALKYACGNQYIEEILDNAFKERAAGMQSSSPIEFEEVPNAPLLDNMYEEIGSYVAEPPSLYPDLSCELQAICKNNEVEIGSWNASSSVSNSNWEEPDNSDAEKIVDNGLDLWASNKNTTAKVDHWTYDTSDQQANLPVDTSEKKGDENNSGIPASDKEEVGNNLSVNDQSKNKCNSSPKQSLKEKAVNLLENNQSTQPISKSISELKIEVSNEINIGRQLNCPENESCTFAESKINDLCKLLKGKKDKQDLNIASSIVCDLVSKGAKFNKETDRKLNTIFKNHKNHKINIKKAEKNYSERMSKLREVGENAVTNGQLNSLGIDNTTFHFEYSPDSTVDIVKITNRIKDLNLDRGSIEANNNIIQVGKNKAEVEIRDNVRNYTDIFGDDGILLTFNTSLGKLNIRLYPDKNQDNQIKVEVEDREKFFQLKNTKEEVGKNCLLGGSSVFEAVEKGNFERRSWRERIKAERNNGVQNIGLC
ncbi:ankyrin repeat domain-containing protein [Wolbachia endosymbiont of Pentidionis agamae]|uniref:ankyrin repeat domain-containing protein n=1 Tax=Wolbachia endosymbiont of Pentidionis agamae TaxID=3110435 RepID=UPI002FD686EC